MTKSILSIVGIAVLAAALIFARSATTEQNTTALEEFSDSLEEATTTEAEVEPDQDAPPFLGTRPEFENLDGWVQGEAQSVAATNGKVRIVHFWALSCHNCHATFPFIKEIRGQYPEDDLEIIGIHAPEFDFEKNPDLVLQEAVERGISWPHGIDNNKENFRAWRPENRGWPMTFVLDQDGNVRFERKGEGAYDRLADTVNYLVENGA